MPKPREEKQKDLRSRTFCVTGWDHIEGCLEKLKEEAEVAEYAIIGREIAPTTGKIHYQCYFRFESQRWLKAVMRRLPDCDVRIARGSTLQASDYCYKDEDLVLEKGSRAQQGKRTDLIDVENLQTMAEVMRSGVNYQAARCHELRLKYLERQRDFKPIVIWIYGKPRIGKTKCFKDAFPDIFSPLSFKWWEGYDAHEAIILDDIRDTWCDFVSFLKLIDRYPYRVETKGGSRQLLARYICITCPFPPLDVWRCTDTEENGLQLTGRIDHVLECTKDFFGEVHYIFRPKDIRKKD